MLRTRLGQSLQAERWEQQREAASWSPTLRFPHRDRKPLGGRRQERLMSSQDTSGLTPIQDSATQTQGKDSVVMGSQHCEPQLTC